ncbi:hypothetical protein AEMCBJ_05115 [Cupriavidus necator]|uniref:hypothetical protein n=1 Tax=Cupriavidus necator TaxID=106590 RepID=UPI003F73E80B
MRNIDVNDPETRRAMEETDSLEAFARRVGALPSAFDLGHWTMLKILVGNGRGSAEHAHEPPAQPSNVIPFPAKKD